MPGARTLEAMHEGNENERRATENGNGNHYQRTRPGYCGVAASWGRNGWHGKRGRPGAKADCGWCSERKSCGGQAGKRWGLFSLHREGKIRRGGCLAQGVAGTARGNRMSLQIL